MDILMLGVLFVGGVISGMYGSVVGSGGLVSFPLVLWTGLPVDIAIATNRFGAMLLELSSSGRFWKAKQMPWKEAALLGVLAVAGSVVGARLVVEVSESLLEGIVAVALVLVLLLLLGRSRLGIVERLPKQSHWICGGVGALGLGVYGGFFGVGFGTFISMIFLLVGLDFVRSAAASRLVGFLMSAAATAVFATQGMIDYQYGLALGLGLALGGWIGAGWGISKGNTYIRALFLVVIVATVGKLVFWSSGQTIDLGQGYKRAGENILYQDTEYGTGLVQGADIETFEVLEHGFARDRFRVYRSVVELDQADPEKFVVTGPDRGNDGVHFYECQFLKIVGPFALDKCHPLMRH